MTRDRQPAPTLVAAACAIGLACVMFDQTSLVVAVATIGADLSASLAGLQWLSALMPLVAASALPISAAVAKRVGARTALQVGLLIFASGSAMAALAQSLTPLLIARVVQGLGAALILPSGPALLGHNVPAGTVRQRAVGSWMAMGSIGLIAGPLLGGILIEQFGWRITFVTLVPLALAGILSVSFLANTERTTSARIDVAGLVLVCLTLGTLCFALIETGRGNASLVVISVSYLSAAVFFTLFLLVERRAVNPVLDPHVLNSPLLRLLLPSVLAYNAVINGSAFIISMHLQQGRGLSAALAGILLLVANLGMPLAGTFSSAMSRYAKPSTLMLACLGALVLAFAVLSLGEAVSIPVLVLPLLAFGLAAGFLYSLDTLAVLNASQGPSSANAVASLALMRQVGSVLGIAALASIGGVAVSLELADRPEQPALIAGGLALLALGLLLSRRMPRLLD